jgi:hypothetical protein
MKRANALARFAGLPVRLSDRSALDMRRRPAFTPSQRSGSGSHEREEWPTQGSRVSPFSCEVISCASVRPARFVVATPSPT